MTGKVNSGLIPVWERGNTQGLWDMGGRPVPDMAGLLSGAKVVLMAGVDPAKDDPTVGTGVGESGIRGGSGTIAHGYHGYG